MSVATTAQTALDAFRAALDELQDAIAGEDRFAFTLKCTYPTGELVMATSICEVRDHRITRQTGVEAWDE